MLKDNAQTTSALQVDLIAIDALFRRIAERGRKARTQTQSQTIGDQEQASKDTRPAKDNQNIKQAGK